MPDLSERFVASVARALNLAQVPCVLWGHYLLNVHGVPSIIGSIDFVVPDDSLRTATEALNQLQNLTPCPDCETCPASSSERPTPPPAYHLHVDAEVTVGLYPQSDTLWFLPPLDNSLLNPKKRTLPSPFALASDKTLLPLETLGRGSGAFVSAEDPVVVLKSHVLLEAFMRLYARDADRRIGSFALAMVAYMWEYVDGDGFLDLDQLPEPLRTLYKKLKDGRPVRPWTEELRGALGVSVDVY